ncbi:conserved hypothetical protein [Arthrobacter sp. 8AJ]|nr:conserved hypothetical protein [Arthrobacter sp. 8AJ]
MQPFSPDPATWKTMPGWKTKPCSQGMPGCHPVPGSKAHLRFRTRLAEALCRERSGDAGPGDTSQESAPACRKSGNQPRLTHDQGSAVVEFTFLALLLMVPLVYFVITVGQIQGGSFAVVGAADQAAKVYVAQPDAVTAQAAAEQAVALALSDFGHQADRASMTTACSPADCQAAGSTVTVTVSLSVPLPYIPFAEGLSATEVQASSSQLVGRYR